MLKKDQLETKESLIDNGGVDENQCKICWEKVIDCVLLDCGHMLTCTECGKVLSECKFFKMQEPYPKLI